MKKRPFASQADIQRLEERFWTIEVEDVDDTMDKLARKEKN